MRADSTALRPLGLGEILDRAVSLCVTHFVPLTTLFVVYAVPYAVVQFFASADLARMMRLLTDAVTAQSTGGTHDPAAITRALSYGGGFNAWYPVFMAAVFFVGPLPAAALIEACSAFYLRRSTTFASAYRVALERWLPLVGVNALYVLSGVLLYLVVVLLTVAIVLALAIVSAQLHAVGVALSVIVGIVVTVAALLFFIVVTLAFQVSYFTCVVEREGPVVSFSRGIRRVFSGVGLRRSLLVGCAFAAIAIGIALVATIGEAVLVGLAHSAVAGAIFSALVRVATAAFTTAFIAIFYFDLRVREEGFDLQLAAQDLQTQSLQAT